MSTRIKMIFQKTKVVGILVFASKRVNFPMLMRLIEGWGMAQREQHGHNVSHVMWQALHSARLEGMRSTWFFTDLHNWWRCKTSSSTYWQSFYLFQWVPVYKNPPSPGSPFLNAETTQSGVKSWSTNCPLFTDTQRSNYYPMPGGGGHSHWKGVQVGSPE